MKKSTAVLLTSGATAAIVYLTKKDLIKEQKNKLITEKNKLMDFKNELYEALKESAKIEKNIIDEKMREVSEERETFEEEKELFHKSKEDALKEIENKKIAILQKETQLEKEKENLKEKTDFLNQKDKTLEEKNNELLRSQKEMEELFEEKQKHIEKTLSDKEKGWEETKKRFTTKIGKLEKENENLNSKLLNKEPKTSSFAEKFLDEWRTKNENKGIVAEGDLKPVSEENIDTENKETQRQNSLQNFAEKDSMSSIEQRFPQKGEFNFTENNKDIKNIFEEIENKEVPAKISDEFFSEVETMINKDKEKTDIKEAKLEGNATEELNDLNKDEPVLEIETKEENLAETDPETLFTNNNENNVMDIEKQEKASEVTSVKVNDIKIFSYSPIEDAEDSWLAMFTVKFEKIDKNQVDVIIGENDDAETKTLNVMDNEISFSLNPNEKALVKDIPVNTIFSITQKPIEGITTKSIRLRHKDLGKAIRKTKVDPNDVDAQAEVIKYFERHNALIERNCISNVMVKENKGEELDTYLFVNSRFKEETVEENKEKASVSERFKAFFQ